MRGGSTLGGWDLLRKPTTLRDMVIINHNQAADGSRAPSGLELELAEIQGEQFGLTVSKVNFA
jgi:hypothetical protein